MNTSRNEREETQMAYFINTITGARTEDVNEAWDWKEDGVIVEQWTLLYPEWRWYKTIL
jgi:hypothetical protein